MRIGLVLPQGRESDAGRSAEAAGLFGVLVEGGLPGSEMIAAAQVAAVTEAVRIVVRVPLGSEHPITLAEEAAVLDNLSGGRVVVLADTADLDLNAAAEDLELLRLAWAARPVRHRGRRWRVPAGFAGQAVADAVEVTPKPAQVEMPVWLRGPQAAALAARTGLPSLAQRIEDVRSNRLVEPAASRLIGDLESDRAAVGAWAQAGATHLLLDPGAAEPASMWQLLSRYLAPEVAMPGFPRILAESHSPLPWPGPTGG